MVTSYLIKIIACVLIMTVYGYVRAFTAFKLGDKSREVKSRLTLNPMEQLDPIGIILFVVFGVGFIKPMRVNSTYFKDRKRDLLICTILPIVVVIFGSILISKMGVLILFKQGFYNISGFLLTLQFSAVYFGIYNLIPAYPLDGEKLITALGSPNTRMKFSEYSNIATMVVMILTLIGFVKIPISIIANIFFW